jgi:hypothetical protein
MMLEKKQPQLSPTVLDMYSRMGKATSSHFSVLNPENKNKQKTVRFNADFLLNPALRAAKSSHVVDWELL